ncbi:MAG: carbohydrate binding domain-containing protein, partial [Cytophagaceae bacterium]|nr:carbohydrate binding domain-containing protein [Cytophagaceae bacterium]
MQFNRLLFLSVFALFLSSSFAQNVLKNSGMEDLEGWNNWGNGVQDTSKHSGEYSLKISNDEFKWSGADQIIIFPKGAKRLTLSGWMRTENVEKGSNPWESARIAVEFYNEDGKQVGGYPQATAQVFGTTAWRPYKRMYPIPPDAANVKIQLALGNAKGTVWFDDVEATLTGEGGVTMEAGSFLAAKPTAQDSIRINQIGYHPDGPKVAVVVAPTSDKF